MFLYIFKVKPIFYTICFRQDDKNQLKSFYMLCECARKHSTHSQNQIYIGESKPLNYTRSQLVWKQYEFPRKFSTRLYALCVLLLYTCDGEYKLECICSYKVVKIWRNCHEGGVGDIENFVLNDLFFAISNASIF